MIHLQDALSDGLTTALVRTVDTNVVVILLGKFHHLVASCPAADIWNTLGTRKAFTYVHVVAAADDLGEAKCLTLPGFDSFTGCDTVSLFFGKGLRTAWQAWNSFTAITEAFSNIALNPYKDMNELDNDFELLEHYTVVLYDNTIYQEYVNNACKELFCQKNKTIDNIPPTLDALLHHSKHAACPTGIWATSDQTQ